MVEVDFPECPPAELARFLARKSVSGDVQKASKLIVGYLEWRKGGGRSRFSPRTWAPRGVF